MPTVLYAKWDAKARSTASSPPERRGQALVVSDDVLLTPWDSKFMSREEVDTYLASLDEPKRDTLRELRQIILDFVPEAEQGISYGLPAFRLQGKVIAGFAAFQRHLSYLPHSGSVFPELRDEVAAYVTSTGALRFAIDECLPVPLVQKLLAVRIRQALPD